MHRVIERSVSEFNALCISLAIQYSERCIVDEKCEPKKSQSEQTLTFTLQTLPKIPQQILFLNLKHLTAINLVNIQLSSVPDEIGLHFPNLENLCLDENNLMCLPETIGNLKNLKKLSFRRNGICELPTTLEFLKFLRCLDASFNKIEKVPRLDLPSLSELLLENNLICEFSIQSHEFNSLRILNLSHNTLEMFHGELPAMKNTAMLYLHHNNLNKIPELLTQMEGIIEVDISCNLIDVLPVSFKSESIIEKLHLNCNRIKKLPKWFFQLSHIKELSFHCNPIELDSFSNFNMKSYCTLEVMNMSNVNDNNCHDVELPYEILPGLPNQFTFLENITDMNFSGIKLNTLPDSIGYLKFLRALHLASNLIAQLPESFCNLTSLEYFNISCNRLQKLPNSFGALSSLQRLTMNNNYLTDLPESFSKLKNLRHLDLVGNEFKLFPEALLLLSSISYLKIESGLINFGFQYSDAVSRSLHLVPQTQHKDGKCAEKWREEDDTDRSVESDRYSESSESGNSLEQCSDIENNNQSDAADSENWDEEIDDNFPYGSRLSEKFLPSVYYHQSNDMYYPAQEHAALTIKDDSYYNDEASGQFSDAD